MANKNLDTALVAAMTVATVVIFSTAGTLLDKPHTPKTAPKLAITTNAITPSQNLNEATVPATEATAPNTPPVTLYDVPLDAALQLHIIQVAESYGIDPAILFAMAYRESTYNPASIGDRGASFGLLQIQPRWHSDRMARLGCTDLLDPYQNVIVGADYLAQQLQRYGGDMGKALVAYNAGHYSGTITTYAQVVLEIAEELRGTTYEANR